VQRKIVGLLPPESLRWAYLSKTGSGNGGDCGHGTCGFAPQPVHWRLRSIGAQHLWTHLQSGVLAGRIARWADVFRPDVLWLASDMEGLTVGRRLARLLGVPVHLTAYDAFEWCRFCSVPGWYVGLYMREVRRFLKEVVTMDAVSPELLQHISRLQAMPKLKCAMTLRPSIDSKWAAALPAMQVDFSDGAVRRVGFCGASRVSDRQWASFVSALGSLPWSVEIHAFASPVCFHDAHLPKNVRLIYRDYLDSEKDVIVALRSAGVHATYLGLWREPERGFFARTSLSSKLTTYAGVGVPVIADTPADAAAWKLLDRYGAGVLLPAGEDAASAVLRTVLGDEVGWARLADGVVRMRDREYDLSYNVECLKQVLSVCAGTD
jgi:hypothetical protein